MSSNSQEDIKPMIATYKKLFLILSVITLIGIGLVLLHVPLWIVLLVGFSFMIIKSFVVYESFKNLLVGRNGIIILFALTVMFLITLLLLPIFNQNGHIVGTVDISKQFMMDQSGEKNKVEQKESSHGH
jgi:hypothetical protein